MSSFVLHTFILQPVKSQWEKCRFPQCNELVCLPLLPEVHTTLSSIFLTSHEFSPAPYSYCLCLDEHEAFLRPAFRWPYVNTAFLVLTTTCLCLPMSFLFWSSAQPFSSQHPIIEEVRADLVQISDTNHPLFTTLPYNLAQTVSPFSKELSCLQRCPPLPASPIPPHTFPPWSQ